MSRPVVNGRVVGGPWHGLRPISVGRAGRLGIVTQCLARFGDVLARNQADVAAAADIGRRHLADVDHSPAAVAR